MTFKVTEEVFDQLVEKEGIGQARYFAKRQWVAVDNISLLNREEWEYYLAESHRLVASKLTWKKRTELGIE